MFFSQFYLKKKQLDEIDLNLQLTGLLAVYSEKTNTTLTEKLIGNVWHACKEKSDAAHRESLWRATAMLIHSSKLDRKLLNCIASSQVRLQECNFIIIIILYGILELSTFLNIIFKFSAYPSIIFQNYRLYIL